MTTTAHLPAMRTRLLNCGLLAGPLFVLTFLLEGAFKGNGYSQLRHPVSSLALGNNGWIQTVNFLVAGVLTVLFAIGLWQTSAPEAVRKARLGAVLVGVWGVGLLGAGLFTTDPVSGFPLGTPATVEYTTSGALHDAFSLPAFLALGVAMVVLARGWVLYSLLSAASFAMTFMLASAGFSQTESLVEVGGFFQRIAVIIGWSWLAALAWRRR
ncbi:DUF998 domain-containing protein [Kribbella sp. NPDC051718]|uniref:DUF998 domain-containing protein n=1 Tax=Kribbella sp. NPDC051718 TaxID=3155168 RepID=UPI0034151019